MDFMMLGEKSRNVWGRPLSQAAWLLRRWDAVRLEAIALCEITGVARVRLDALSMPRAIRVRNPGASTAETSVRARGPPHERV